MRVLLSLLLFFAGAAHASDLAVDVNPSSPIVIDSMVTMINGSTVMMTGRWFATGVYIKNQFDTPVTIESVEFHIRSVEGVAVTKSLQIGNQELAPGASLNLQRQYIDGVPDSSSFEYEVSLEINGHKGDAKTAGEKLLTVKFLKTQ
jgi:hypothetical protein